MSTHCRPQAVCVGGQLVAHMLFTHSCPSGQRWAHAPQFVRSFASSAQKRVGAPPSVPVAVVWHVVNGAEHATPHRLRLHTCPAGHTVPQAPQFSRSVAMVAHKPPQICCGDGHWATQAPLRHTIPALQETPHSPQLSRSIVVSTQTPPQKRLGLAQVGAAASNAMRPGPQPASAKRTTRSAKRSTNKQRIIEEIILSHRDKLNGKTRYDRPGDSAPVRCPDGPVAVLDAHGSARTVRAQACHRLIYDIDDIGSFVEHNREGHVNGGVVCATEMHITEGDDLASIRRRSHGCDADSGRPSVQIRMIRHDRAERGGRVR